MPFPLAPVMTSGLYFLPGSSATARTARTTTRLPADSMNSSSSQCGDGPGGGAPPSRARASSASAAARSPGSRSAGEPARSGAMVSISACSSRSRPASFSYAASAASGSSDVSRSSSASSRAVRKPSPPQRITASATRDRHDSTCWVTEAETSWRKSANSSTTPPAGAGSGGAASAGPSLLALRARSRWRAAPVTVPRASPGVSGSSLTAWSAISLLSAPSSSRTLSISSSATASSTPAPNTAFRSSARRRRMATRVS